MPSPVGRKLKGCQYQVLVKMQSAGSLVHGKEGGGKLAQPLWETIHTWPYLRMLSVHFAYEPTIFTPTSTLQRRAYLYMFTRSQEYL